MNITKTSRNPLAVIPIALSETQQSMATDIAKELANLVTNAEFRNINTKAGKRALDILQKWERSKANIHAIRFLTTLLNE